MQSKTHLSKRQGGGYERFIGSCIYCGSTEQLSDEHVIPEGLGGRDILRSASCETCRVETGKFEQHVLRGMLWAMRIRLGIKGKRKHPETIPVYIQREGQSGAVEQVSPGDVRVAAILPSFSRPGLLIGAPSGEVPEGKLHLYGREQDHARLMALGMANEETATMRVFEFARMVAKIAHCHAVLCFEKGSFESFLPPAIINRDDRLYDYVGNSEAELPISDTEYGSWACTEVRAHTGGTQLILTKLRVLSQLPTPVYEVITGVSQAGSPPLEDELSKLNPTLVPRSQHGDAAGSLKATD
jgi:hypothetical protein